jgi:formylglycine-generating enzyme required for sulfatase activity/tetratricopeptide (TPR) repeat protein
MTLIAVQPGLFHPGDYGKPASWDGPLPTVVLTRPFFLVDQEVTAEWYRRFLDSDDHPDGEKLTEAARRADLSSPVANVDWASAVLFCNWLSRAEGRTPCYRPDASGRLGLTCDFRANGYRLPTNAEWEYVFRYGTSTRFVTGDDVTRMMEYGSVFGTSLGPGKTFYPNPWGFFDLVGNGWEMSWDDGYTPAAVGLTMNPVGAAGSAHTIRGGSAEAGLYHLHASFYWPHQGNESPALIRLVCGPLDAGADEDEKTAALRTLTRWLERIPDSRPQVWKERGRLHAEAGHVEEAAADYAHALELAPRSPWMAADVAQRDDVFDRVFQARPQDSRLWFARLDWLGRRGRWRDAAVLSAKLVDLEPANATWWFYDAALRLQTGDTEGYRRDCREMLSRFQGTIYPYVADYTAKTCLLQPDAVADLQPVLKLARHPLTGMENDVAYPWFLLCKALADYRTGRFGEAVDGINRMAPTPDGECRDATAYVVLALAQHRRSLPDEARQALSQARLIRNRKWPKLDAGELFDGNWPDWLRCEVLRREAEPLIDPGR